MAANISPNSLRWSRSQMVVSPTMQALQPSRLGWSLCGTNCWTAYDPRGWCEFGRINV